MLTLAAAARNIAALTIDLNTQLATLSEHDGYRVIAIKRTRRNIAEFALAVGCADFDELKRDLAAAAIENAGDGIESIELDGLCAVAEWRKHGTQKTLTDDVR